MRIRDIISIGSSFITLGIIVVALIGVILLVYNLIRKFKKQKKVTFPIGSLLLCAVFIIYLVVVVGATMLRYRMHSFAGGIGEIYPLFYSYKEAWNHFSAREWRNIILNIMMFVPFGFLLPLVSKKFQVFWKTYLAGFLFTFLIEMTQLLFNLGICELDDFMNNTVGAMIGYGFYRLFVFVVNKWKKQETKALSTVCFQIPVFVTLISFALIFGNYHNDERMENKSNASESELIQVLEKMCVTIPKGAVFEEKKEEYSFTADKIVKDGKMYDGSIQCEYTTDGMISHLTNNIIEYEEYKSFPIISEKEAFNILQKGYFLGVSDKDYEVLEVTLDYELDTKGFYQPVFVFSVLWDEIESTINIPAIRK